MVADMTDPLRIGRPAVGDRGRCGVGLKCDVLGRSGRTPDGVNRLRIAVASRAREKAGRDVEGERSLLVAGCADVQRCSFLHELPRERHPRASVIGWLGSACEVEGVLVVGTRNCQELWTRISA